MEQNKIRTYFLYAIGEILLVVIGILLALQVNNWNEERAYKSYEITILSELHSALEQDIERVQMSKAYLNQLKHSLRELVAIKDNPAHPRDSLMYHVNVARRGGMSVVFNYSPYESLKSSGLDRISSSDLRRSLSLLYEVQLGQVDQWINEVVREALYRRAEFNQDFLDFKAVIDSTGGVQPELAELSYEVISGDPKFDQFIIHNGGYIGNVLNRLSNAEEAMNTVEKQIEEYLESK